MSGKPATRSVDIVQKAHFTTCSTIPPGLISPSDAASLPPYACMLLSRRLEHGASTSDVLAAAMGVYSYPFFASSELSEFVASVAAEKFAQPKLYVLAADRDELRPEHLLARVPVFYGRPVRSMYDDEALKGLTGCTTAEAMASSSGPVYAIGGRTPVLGRPGHHLHALHGWGLNFEGNTTRDYLRYVKDGRLIAADVKHEVRRRVWLWASAAFDFADANHRARWCLPAIGFGAFLSALPSRSVNEPVLRRAFVDALSHAALSLRPRLTIELRDRGGTFLSEAEALRSSGVVYSHGDEGDLFRDPGKAVDAAGNILVESERLVLMNAWDDRHAFDDALQRCPRRSFPAPAAPRPGCHRRA